jgi:hypothetical protein
VVGVFVPPLLPQERAQALGLSVRDAEGQGLVEARLMESTRIRSGLEQHADEVAAPQAVGGLQSGLAAAVVALVGLDAVDCRDDACVVAAAAAAVLRARINGRADLFYAAALGDCEVEAARRVIGRGNFFSRERTTAA